MQTTKSIIEQIEVTEGLKGYDLKLLRFNYDK